MLSPKGIKVLKTANLYLCFFVMGLCVAVPGPCLLDLQHMVQVDTERIGFIYTARSAGYLCGSILGGIALDAINSKQAVMTICNFFVAATMLGIPWSKTLYYLAGCMIVNGFFIGAINTGGNVICLTLWGKDSGPFYQALHFSFGLGCLVAPLIVAPFLVNYSDDIHTFKGIDNSTYSGNLTTIISQFDNHSQSAEAPNLIYPYSTIGFIGEMITLMFLAICIMSPREEKVIDDKNPKQLASKTNFGFMLSLICLNVLLLFVATGTEIGYAQMLTTFVVKSQLQLSSSTGSFMTSIFWGAFTISRLASIFLAIKVSSFTLIIYDLIISLVGSLVLLFLASYEWAIWLASVLLGVGIASLFPAAIAWLDTYIDVTNKIASVFLVGGACGEMLIPFIISYFIEYVPEVLTYVVSTSCISASVIVFILYLILRKRVKKNVDKESECYVVSISKVDI